MQLHGPWDSHAIGSGVGYNEALVLITFLAVLATPASSTFIVKPYLQLGTQPGPGRITVAWHVPKGAPQETVKIGGQVWKEPIARRVISGTGLPAYEIRAVEFKGLLPGRTYRYSIGTESHTLMAPRAPRDDLRFVVLGDPGENSAGQRAIAHQIGHRKPDFVLVVGDIVYPHGRASEYRERWFPIMNAENPGPKTGTQLLGEVMTVGVAGNHDTAYRNLGTYPDGLAFYTHWWQPSTGPKVSARIGGDASPLRYAMGKAFDYQGNFAFQYGRANFIVLDSNTYVNWKSEANRAWLRKELSAAKKRGGPTLVSFHHAPYHSSKKKQDERYMTSITDLLTEFEVALVFSGHVHNYQRTKPISVRSGKEFLDARFNGDSIRVANGTIFVVSGGGGAPLYDQKLAQSPASWKRFTQVYKTGYSFSEVTVTENEITVQQRDTQGAVIDRFTLANP